MARKFVESPKGTVMKVRIKDFAVNMEVGSKGIELEVRAPNNSSQIGDCYATMTGLEWCSGKTAQGNGVKVKWEDLQILCSSVEALKAAIKAAKEVNPPPKKSAKVKNSN